MKDHPKVDEIARLANLDLAGMDRERLTTEFEQILDHLAQLEEVADTAAEPCFHGVTEERPSTPMRADQRRESLPADAAVDQSPTKGPDNQFRVPRVIE